MADGGRVPGNPVGDLTHACESASKAVVDNVTHALAGLLLADATMTWVSSRHSGPETVPMSRRFAGVAAVLGVVAAELPDSDLVYSGSVLGMGKLGYLLHHRGHTHTVVWAVVGALLLWVVAQWWLQRGATSDERTWLAREGRRPLLVLALMGTLSHILLDWTNSYGVHPFWPFDNRWYYGDAVFIVEPWLWVVAIPAVLYSRRSRWAPVILAVLLAVILAASWGLGQVVRPVAILLTLFAALWLVAQRFWSPTTRVTSGIAAWVLVTLVFTLASTKAEALVRASAATDGVDSVRDVILNPAPGDPTCWAGMAVTNDGQFHRLTTVLVAPWAWTGRTPASCVANYPPTSRMGGDVLTALPDATPVIPFANTAAVQWRTSWLKPMSELLGLAMERCEFAAALRFMRAPAWREFGNGTVVLSDVRFGVGGGFAELTIPFSPVPRCSLTDAWIPEWKAPVL